ncbi:TPA: RNA polymerase sporulation sigma factor SigK [bacterium]|nr:RNA polymerase sporulation sigma factor SigK [bacterium]
MLLLDKIKYCLRNYFLLDGEVHYINGSETLLPPLKREDEIKFLEENAKGSLEARNKLIEHNLRLVVYVAKRFESNSFHLEDLISIGTIGLIKAIATFKTDRNIKLATYASRCIENEILMYLRKKAKLKREVSYDQPLKVDFDGNELLLSDILGTDQDEIFNTLVFNDKKEELFEAIDELKLREKVILKMRFGLNNSREMTQKEVADTLGISQSYISRLEKRIIKKLKLRMNQ